jgi:hypothetical protein
MKELEYKDAPDIGGGIVRARWRLPPDLGYPNCRSHRIRSRSRPQPDASDPEVR